MMKPILFSTEMVRAILEGRKTVTRRVVKDPYYIDDEQASRVSGLAIHKGTNITHGMPYEDQIFSPGDVLWVRETFFKFPAGGYAYKADANSNSEKLRVEFGYRWRPSIHMPREAARIWLRVTDVRVERVQQITAKDVLAEGVGKCSSIGERFRAFRAIWDSTIKPADLDCYGWAANPWVWVIEFERCEKPEEV